MNGFVERLDIFYGGVFSEICTVGGTPVRGLFDDPFAVAEDVEGSRPTFKFPSARLPLNTSEGTPVVRQSNGAAYTVVGAPKESGTGETTLVLQKV